MNIHINVMVIWLMSFISYWVGWFVRKHLYK